MKKTKTRQPNFLLIVTDQWRGDCLGSEGHPAVRTPHLDEIAKRGSSFVHAYCATPSCVAARAALLTGLKQENHGFVGYNDRAPWNYDCTLPQTLAAGGYHTQCVGKMHVNPARQLMGFHNIVLHDGYLHRDRQKGQEYAYLDDYSHWLKGRHKSIDVDYTDSGLGCNGYAVHPWPHAEMEHPSAWATTESINFLHRRDPTKPFFLMTSYHRPHPPLDPPPSVWQRYQNMEMPENPIGDWVTHPQQSRAELEAPVPLRPEEIADVKRAYYAQMTFIDSQINRLTLALREHHVRENTIIIFTADHGDMLYDHHFIAKSLPFEGSSRIPLFFYIPPNLQKEYGIEPGQRLEEVTELRDIFPTLCEMAGIAIPEGIDGNSALPLLQNKAPNKWRDYLHGEHSSGIWGNHWLCSGREKYCWFSQTGRELLFDLEADPLECHNLAEKKPERTAYWRDLLCQELKGREEGYVLNGKLITGKPSQDILSKSRNAASLRMEN